MDTTKLTSALRDATANLEPRLGFANAVIKGGRRRQLRNRLTIATGLTAVATLVGAGTYALWMDSAPGAEVLVGDPRLDQPTRGDLGSKRAFVNDAARAWREGLHRSWNAGRGIFNDLRGQPHVYWAGNTPAGPAAVVMQQAYLHPHDNLGASDFNTTTTLIGMVAADPADGRLKLVGDGYNSADHTALGMTAGNFQFGPGDRTVLIVDFGKPLYLASEPADGPGGTITRGWQRMSVADGVAIAQLPEGCDPAQTKVLARDGQPAPEDKEFAGLVPLVTASSYLAPEGSPGLERIALPLWRGEQSDVVKRVGAPSQVTELVTIFTNSLNQAGALDFGGGAVANGQWFVVAGLADGRTAIVSERVLEKGPNTLFAVLVGTADTNPAVLPGYAVDPKAALPVRLHLPDGQGWVVADYGAALRFRSSTDGPWQDAGHDAALLPDDAAQVEVSRNGAAPTVVNLAG